MISVFISYNSKDIDFARRLEDSFVENHIEVWLYKDKLHPGDLILASIGSAIESIDYVVALISNNSINSPWVKKEISLALTKEIEARKTVIIPVRLDDCKIPLDLRDKVYADFRVPEDYEKEFLRILEVINENKRYLGKIARGEVIKAELQRILADVQDSSEDLIIRLRAAFTSMSNIRHHQEKPIFGLLAWQATRLDDLLEAEKNLMSELLALQVVHLKCICWPKESFLSEPYYTKKEREERKKLMRDFLQDSLDDTYARRQIVCDESAKYSNQLIFGKLTAIMANPKSGGYTETSVFKDRETVDVLVREFDHQFHRIRKQRMCALIQERKPQREFLLREVICALDGQRPV